MTPPDADPDDADELELLFEVSARHAIDHPDGFAFVEWFAKTAPLVAPSFAAGFAGDDDERRSGLRVLGQAALEPDPAPRQSFSPAAVAQARTQRAVSMRIRP